MNFKTQHQEAKTSTGFIFWKVSNLHQRLQRDRLKDLDITPTQFSLLASYFYISEKLSSPISQSTVSEHSGLDKMVVSDVTKALLAKRLITKKKSKEDRRAYLIDLTEKGKKICNLAVVRIEELDAEFFSRSGDENHFNKLLQKLLGSG